MICYVHDVSPVKTSSRNKRYFDCLLQSEQLTRRAVSFSPEKQPMFHSIQKNKSPIKIKKFKIDETYKDIVIETGTEVSNTPPPQSFQRVTCYDHDTTLTISSLANIASEQLVTFKAKVHLLRPVTQQPTTVGQDILKKREAVLVDETSSITLKLWENFVGSVEQGKCYKFVNLRYRKTRTDRYVNTPKNEPCQIVPCEDFEHPLAEVDVDTTTVEAEAKFVGITTITKSMKCCACPSGFVEPEQNGYDGTSQNKRCKLRQKLKHTTTEWYIKFFVQLYDKNQQKVYLSCYNEVVDKVCHVLHIKHQDLTTSELTDEILKYDDHYLITYDVIQKKIIDFEKLPGSNEHDQ